MQCADGKLYVSPIMDCGEITAYKLPCEQVRTIIFRYVFACYHRVRIYTRNPLGLPPVRYREWVQAHRPDAA